jgi:adenosylcobyric acid synthase
MIQGTMSNVGKSLLTAGLCRVFRQDGYRVAPFKSQNMALNSFVTAEGLEMGRAQAMQAEAAGIAPRVAMNPVLLKPVTDTGAQVIVQGEVRGNMSAAAYFAYRRALIPEIMRAFGELAGAHDIVVIEGAGSPAEINLGRDDIVNMGLARLTDSPVLLVGDIDRGGVFAQLAGTLMLLEADERARVKGCIVNKFRGDAALLRPGLAMLEARCGKPVVGVLPMLAVDIEEEDSLSRRFGAGVREAALDIAVVRLPMIANFTDFMALEATAGVGLRYVDEVADLGRPDMLILPGSKNTIADLRWLRQGGLEAAIVNLARRGVVILGLCGGYQMLGRGVRDTAGVEGGGEIMGMGLLPVDTAFHAAKTRLRRVGRIAGARGALHALEGAAVEGYEIHMGATRREDEAPFFIALEDGQVDGCVADNVAGTYLHGFFDAASCRAALLDLLCERKGIAPLEGRAFDFAAYKSSQYDKLADAVRGHVDMEFVYRVVEGGGG